MRTVHEERYSDGQLKLRVNYADVKLDGLSEEWYDNGQLRERATYKNGKIEGQYKLQNG